MNQFTKSSIFSLSVPFTLLGKHDSSAWESMSYWPGWGLVRSQEHIRDFPFTRLDLLLLEWYFFNGMKLLWFIPWKKLLFFQLPFAFDLVQQLAAVLYDTECSLACNNHYSSWQVSDLAVPNSDPDFQGFHPWVFRDSIIQFWPKAGSSFTVIWQLWGI